MQKVLGNGDIVPPFLTSALDEGEWSTSRPSRFISRVKNLSTHRIEAGWAPDPVWTLWKRVIFLSPLGNGTPAVQTAGRRYVDVILEAGHSGGAVLPAGILGSNPTRGIDVCLRSLCVCVALCK
jgi:hypothetical protein